MATASRFRKAPSNPLVRPLTVSWLWRLAAVLGGTISGLYVVYTAWTGFGWWEPAGVAYVDDHVTKAIAPIASKVDAQGVSILSGRIETLKASKQLQSADKARLDLQTRTTKDPVALQIITAQQKSIDDTIKGIDEQLATLSAQLQTQLNK